MPVSTPGHWGTLERTSRSLSLNGPSSHIAAPAAVVACSDVCRRSLIEVGDAGSPPDAPQQTNSKPVLVLLLIVNLYFDSSAALWQQAYKDDRLNYCGTECEPLIQIVEREGGELPKACKDAHPSLFQRPNIEVEEETAENCGKHGDQVTEEPHCPWKLQRKVFDPAKKKYGAWKAKAQTFTVGVALFIEAVFGIAVYYSLNYFVGGYEQLRMCFDMRRMARFIPVGTMFGFSSVCAFLAQRALQPGSYALYAQSGIVIVPIMWRIIFWKPLSVVTWFHIAFIAMGIVMYRMSESDINIACDGEGLFWVLFKVLAAGLASILAEMMLKNQTDVPFIVQVSYILPIKAFSCLLTVFLLPPHGWKSRPGGPLHDWTFFTLLVLIHSLGDTVMSSVIAKTFDSVVKAICGVVGIIFPTWTVSYALGWEKKVDLSNPADQLKVTGGILVVVASLAYVFGRADAAKLDEALKDKQLAEERVAGMQGIEMAQTS